MLKLRKPLQTWSDATRQAGHGSDRQDMAQWLKSICSRSSASSWHCCQAERTDAEGTTQRNQPMRRKHSCLVFSPRHQSKQKISDAQDLSFSEATKVLWTSDMASFLTSTAPDPHPELEDATCCGPTIRILLPFRACLNCSTGLPSQATSASKGAVET